MASAKVTVTLQSGQVAEIRALVSAGRAPNVSAFVQHAVQIALHDKAGWAELLKEALDQTGGPITDKERAFASAALEGQIRKKGSPAIPGT